MLTPQEVAQRSFTKASFGGYNMAMVDDFLDELTKDYESLYNENALLKQKLGVLTSKIREYQSIEEAMRRTLLAAEDMSQKMLKDTEAECARMLAEAQAEAAAMREEALKGIAEERRKFAEAKASVDTYRAQVRQLCLQQIDFLDHLDELAPTMEELHDERVGQVAEDIHAAVERSLAQEDAQPKDPEATRRVPDVGTPAPQPEGRRVAPPTVGEESSVSLYEQLMAQRREAAGEETPPEDGDGDGDGDGGEDPGDSTAPTLKFGRDFKIE